MTYEYSKRVSKFSILWAGRIMNHYKCLISISKAESAQLWVTDILKGNWKVCLTISEKRTSKPSIPKLIIIPHQLTQYI
jgi:hypothetical protein